MRHVRKGPEPKTVVETRCADTTNLGRVATARAAYDQIDKPVAREALAREQGWLCAFCMRRVRDDARDERGEPTMKIAHRVPIDVDSNAALDGSNLLGSCDGGQRSGGRFRSCDLAQGPRALRVDPVDANHMALVRCERDASCGGLRVTATDASLAEDLEVLGLNAHDLLASRAAARRAFQELCRRRRLYGKPGWREHFPRWKAERSVERDGAGAVELPEWIGVVEARL